MAARKRDRRSLKLSVRSKWVKIQAVLYLFTESVDLDILRFSLTDLAGSTSGQGHWFRAAMVRVVSRELEKVRTEQYHCHGLRAVIHS